MSKDLHRLLFRQLRKILGDEVSSPPKQKADWDKILQSLNKAYGDFDQERYLLERSLHLSSKEMQQRWDENVQLINDLQKSETLFKTMNEASPVAVFVADSNGKCAYVNETFKQLFGVDEDQLEGLIWNQLICDEHQAKFRHIWEEASAADPFELDDGFKFKQMNSDNYWWGQLRARPFSTDDGPQGYLGIIADTTEIRQAQYEAEQERLSAFASNQLASLGEMAGGIAHEINNPLFIIDGFTEVLKRMADEEGQVDKVELSRITNKIHATVERISKVVNSLRKLSRNAALDPLEENQAEQIVQDALELCVQRFRKFDIDLRLKKIPSDLMIHCRAVEISQVLLNLLNNAFDAVEDLPEKWIEVDCKQVGNCIEFSVTDAGPGIPDEVVKKMFEPFFTTKKVGKGTGLGLPLCRSIVEGHGGQFLVDSKCKNTRFKIILPNSQAEKKQAS